MPRTDSPESSEVSFHISVISLADPVFRVPDVQNNDDLGASIGLENDDDLFLWNVTFEGPEASLYEVSFLSLLWFPR